MKLISLIIAATMTVVTLPVMADSLTVISNHGNPLIVIQPSTTITGFPIGIFNLNVDNSKKLTFPSPEQFGEVDLFVLDGTGKPYPIGSCHSKFGPGNAQDQTIAVTIHNAGTPSAYATCDSF